MSPERHVSRGSRVQAITQKLQNRQKLQSRQNYERPASRSYTLNNRRTYSTHDVGERRHRFEYDRNDERMKRSAQGRVIDDLKDTQDRTTYKLREKEIDIPKRTISHVVTRLVARTLLIGFWWLILLLWWVLTLLPRCVVFVFIKEKRKHKEEVPADKTSKKYKVSGQNKVRENGGNKGVCNMRAFSLTKLEVFALTLKCRNGIYYS